MTHRFVVASILALLALLAACDRSKPSPTPNGIAIHTLRDTTLSVDEAATRDLMSLDLEERPFATAADITSYSWATHSLSVTPDLRSRLEALGRRPFRSGGIPFVMVARGERVYLGAFWYGYSSSYPRVPYIAVPPIHTPVRLEFATFADADDPRGDRRVHDALRQAGLLAD